MDPLKKFKNIMIFFGMTIYYFFVTLILIMFQENAWENFKDDLKEGWNLTFK